MRVITLVMLVVFLYISLSGYSLVAQELPELDEEALQDLEGAKDLMGEGGPEVGEDAPDFTLQGLDGQEVKLSSFAGKTPVVLIFGSCT